MAKKKRARGRAATKLSDVSLTALQDEIERRRGAATELQDERSALVTRISEIDARLKEMGLTPGPRGRGRPPGRRSAVGGASRSTPRKRTRQGGTGKRGRPRNQSNLVEALRKTLDGKVMSVTDAAKAVQEAGYKTTSPNFRTIVNQTLIKNPEAFEKKARGQYTAK